MTLVCCALLPTCERNAIRCNTNLAVRSFLYISNPTYRELGSVSCESSAAEQQAKSESVANLLPASPCEREQVTRFACRSSTCSGVVLSCDIVAAQHHRVDVQAHLDADASAANTAIGAGLPEVECPLANHCGGTMYVRCKPIRVYYISTTILE
jgi:hypothetical protein